MVIPSPPSEAHNNGKWKINQILAAKVTQHTEEHPRSMKTATGCSQQRTLSLADAEIRGKLSSSSLDTVQNIGYLQLCVLVISECIPSSS